MLALRKMVSSKRNQDMHRDAQTSTTPLPLATAPDRDVCFVRCIQLRQHYAMSVRTESRITFPQRFPSLRADYQ